MLELTLNKGGNLIMTKKLYKTEQDKVICGVCGGIGEYMNLDPNIVRLIAVLITLFSAGFPTVVAYLVMACVLPTKSQTY